MTSVASTADRAVALIAGAFERYRRDFLAITRRAPARFADRDWSGSLHDARERLDLYGRVVNELLGELRPALGAREREETLWIAMRGAYAERVAGHPMREVAETFFNSITRRIFATVGVNPRIEFVDFRFTRVPVMLVDPPLRRFPVTRGTTAAVDSLLSSLELGAGWADRAGDAGRVAREIDRRWEAADAPLPVGELEVLVPPFYRRKGAYLVGRARSGERALPLVLALVNGADGVRVDAALLNEEDVSIVFSFTRSYFHVDAERPSDVVAFLRSLMPSKPLAELYASIGFDKHGKTELYRDLRRHLSRSDERFALAPGAPGMVMAVFTMPSYDVVFKVIRDSFPAEKHTSRSTIRGRYRLVFKHDRAGRLLDDELLAELLSTAGRTVRVDGDRVVIRHLYVQRRVRPLDLYLPSVDPASARRAALDYGQAIRELAATNVFPGDFLLKNFGVTRYGRVVFYDYDELSTLNECHFREMPPARGPEDEMAAEPWFSVGPDDVFPEELARFLPFRDEMRRAFMAAHGELFETGFWRELQGLHAEGAVMDLYPYRDEVRLEGAPRG